MLELCLFNDDMLKIQKDMKFILRSETRTEILNQLFFKASTKKEIKENTDLTYSSITNNLRELEEKGYVSQSEDIYALNNNFKIVYYNLLSLNGAINFVEKESKFFNKHKMFNKKLKSLWNIAPLKDMEKITTDNLDVHRINDLIKDFFIGSKRIRSIFPYLHPDYSEIFEYWLEKNVGVKLILPNDVSRALIEIITKYKPKNGINNRYFKIKTLNRPLNLVVILSDKGILLAFYNKDGSLDRSTVFVSREKSVIEWGYNVYTEYETLGSNYFSLDEKIHEINDKKKK